MKGLFIDGTWCTDPQLLQIEAPSFFKNLFNTNEPCFPPCLKLDNISPISIDMLEDLIKLVSRTKVKQAVFAMSPYKAPGLDGFQPFFSIEHIGMLWVMKFVT